MPEDEFRYRGFASPNYTQVPDDVFDLLMPILSGAELKVLLYIIRRTFGFKKDADAISLNQIMTGITTTDGRVLDRGTGLSESTVLLALKGLAKKEIIGAERRRSKHKGDQPTIYRLRIADPLPENRGRGATEIGDPPPRESGTQETVEQQTEEQETDRSNYSNGQPISLSQEEAEQIAWVVRDIAKELADQAPLKSTTTRAQRLYVQSGTSLDEFIDALQAARLRTKQYTGSIKTERLANGTKPKVAYMFSILEDLVGLKSH